MIYRWDLIKTPAPQAADPLQPAEILRSGLLNRAERRSPELWNVHGRGHLFSVWDLPITIPIRRSLCHQQGRLKNNAWCNMLIWCTMMYSLNFCLRNRGAVRDQLMMGRPMGRQSASCKHVLSRLLAVSDRSCYNGILHGKHPLNLIPSRWYKDPLSDF